MKTIATMFFLDLENIIFPSIIWVLASWKMIENFKVYE